MSETIPSVRLLHLEDSPLDAMLIGEKLKAGGLICNVVQADGRGAFEGALDGQAFDLILCDYNLPDYDGISALRLAQEKLPDVPVIILSGSVDDEEAVKCLHLGATDYLLKQRLERLVPAINRALQGAADQRKHRRHEEELRESEQRYREIVQTSPDIICLVRGDKIAFINDSGLRLLKVAMAEEALGRSPVEFFHSEYQAAAAQRIARLAETPGTVAMTEEQMVATDGTVVNVEVWGVSFMLAGQLAIQMICRDITERKRVQDALRASEEHFRQLAETIEDVFWITSAQGKELIYVSPAYEKIWGRSTASLYANPRDWTAAVLPEDLASVMQGLQRLHSGQPFDIEFRIRRPDGELRHIHDRGFAIRGADGQVHRAVGVARDITQRKEAEAVFRQRASELERFHRLSVGREGRMVELKQEVNELAMLAGRPAPYDLSFLKNGTTKTSLEHA